MTWGETEYAQAKSNGQRDKKEAVSPSRPLICWTARYLSHAYQYQLASLFIKGKECSLPLRNAFLKRLRSFRFKYFRYQCGGTRFVHRQPLSDSLRFQRLTRLPEITFHLIFAIQLSIGKFTYGKGGSFLRLIANLPNSKSVMKAVSHKKR